MPPPVLRRPRLLHALSAHTGSSVACVIAAGGSGKTVLAELIRAARSTTEPVHVVGAEQTLSVMERLSWDEGPATTVIDSVERLPDAVAAQLASALSGPSPRHRVVFLGRRVPDPLRQIVALPSTTVIDQADLSFDRTETADLADTYGIEPSAELVTAVHRITDGWPAATTALIERVARDGQWPRTVAIYDSMPDDFGELLRSFSGALTPEENETFATVCSLDRFDDTVASAVGGPGFAQRLHSAGVPLVDVGGWLKLPGLLNRIRGARPARLPTEAALDHLVNSGEALTVLRMLIDSGRLGQAVDVFDGLSASQLAAIDDDELAVLTMLMEPAMREHPRALLTCARLALRSGNPETVRAPLTHALEHLETIDPQVELEIHQEVLAETAFLNYQTDRLAECRELLARAAPHGDAALQGAARARVLDTRGGLYALQGDPAEASKAIPLLTESIAIWRALGDHTRAGASTRMLGIGVLLDVGRYNEAAALFENQLRGGNCPAYDRAWAHLYLGRVLTMVGRMNDAEASLDTAEQLATALELTMLRGFIAWHRALAAAVRLDAAEVAQLANEAKELLGPVLTTPTGSIFGREIADALARCGEHDPAKEMLDLARELDASAETELARANASVEARFGDASAALAMLDRLESNPDLQPMYAWTLSAYAAIAHRRLGDSAQAQRRAEEALRRAAAAGQPSLPLIIEPHLFETAEEALHPSTGSGSGALELATLGGFSARVHGREVPVSSGRPGMLLEFLALNGSVASIDQVIDVLWGEIDLETGKKRLRNVLQRARAACGDAIERRGDVLRLSDWVGVDLQRALAAARQVLERTDAPADAIDEVLRLLDHQLLPERQYEDWVRRAQDEVDQLRLRLLDQKVETCLAEHQVEPAIAAMEQAIRLDPMDVTRLDEATNVLIDLGRSATANSIRSLAELAAR